MNYTTRTDDAPHDDTSRTITTYRDSARSDVSERDPARNDTLSHDAPPQNPITSDPDANRIADAEFSGRYVADTSSRQDAPERATTRQDAQNQDLARHNTSENAVARSDAVDRDATRSDLENATEQCDVEENYDWVDVEAAAHLLNERGIPRAVRTIQRMCKKGTLACKLVPTENGARYIVDTRSIDAFETRHNAMLPGSNGFGSSVQPQGEPTNPTASSASVNAGNQTTASTDLTDKLNLDHASEIASIKDRHISFLEAQLNTATAQIAVKDEQIHALLERDHETNVLIQNLQGMIGLPGAQPQSSAEQTKPESFDDHRSAPSNDLLSKQSRHGH